ncbi:hypothetical protein O181_091001 [Austropuccinia psidii MF-1]|uniref:Uncharacterized protein n=1 Tax=Austropuccinia psidii MF-1 TaxID=1389203 RepID=A0A9Q3P982_9BASI|nr:hypothetical protein [Austropuccinia psidii MF-1]
MEDLGTVKYVLRIRITLEVDCLTPIQDKSIHQILDELQITDFRIYSSPLTSNIKDFKNSSEPPCTKPPFGYQQPIGLL